MKLRLRNDLARLLVDPSDVSITFEPKPYYLCTFTHYYTGDTWGARLAAHGERIRGWQFYWDNIRQFLDNPSIFDEDHWNDRTYPGWYEPKDTPSYVATEIVLDEFNRQMTQRDKDLWIAFDRVP